MSFIVFYQNSLLQFNYILMYKSLRSFENSKMNWRQFFYISLGYELPITTKQAGTEKVC